MSISEVVVYATTGGTAVFAAAAEAADSGPWTAAIVVSLVALIGFFVRWTVSQQNTASRADRRRQDEMHKTNTELAKNREKTQEAMLCELRIMNARYLDDKQAKEKALTDLQDRLEALPALVVEALKKVV